MLYEEGNSHGILTLDKDLEATRKTETGIDNQQIYLSDLLRTNAQTQNYIHARMISSTEQDAFLY